MANCIANSPFPFIMRRHLFNHHFLDISAQRCISVYDVTSFRPIADRNFRPFSIDPPAQQPMPLHIEYLYAFYRSICCHGN